jgi:single-stranded DNA-binding protein
MASINYSVLTGRLKTDAEKHSAKDGGTFYIFTLYVDDYRMENEKWIKTQGEIDLIVNEAKVKGIESALVKGALIGIEGRLAQRVWQGKDEKPHSNLLLRVHSINLLENNADEKYAGHPEAEAGSLDPAAFGL